MVDLHHDAEFHWSQLISDTLALRGWTRQEMARYCKCTTADLEAIEEGTLEPEGLTREKLLHFATRHDREQIEHPHPPTD